MTDPNAIAALAERIRTAYESGIPCAPLRDQLPEGDLDAAYAIQEANTWHWLSADRRLVGRKIGITSKAVQVQLGVDQPDFGMLFADMAIPDGEEIPAGAVLQPRIEGEVAFVLERDLDHAQPTIADVSNAIGYATAVIEVVGSRIADWNINIQDTIADNASSGLFVLGNERHALEDFDSRLCGMVVEHRGRTHKHGRRRRLSRQPSECRYLVGARDGGAGTTVAGGRYHHVGRTRPHGSGRGR